jgi:hypothetical protein
MRYQSLAAALALVVCWRPCGLAQSPDDGAPLREPPPPPALGPRGGPPHKFLEGLSQETRERFRAAREKALEDPKLQQLRNNAERAKREFFRAMRDKMLEIDPGLADIVRKQAIERRAWKLWRGEGGLRGLTDEERTKLLQTMEKVDSDPAVQAAKEKRWEAHSKDERDAAIENYRKVLRETMLKADPSIAPVLDKLSSEKESLPDPLDSGPGEER